MSGMKGLYHYQGMALYHLSETQEYAVYHRIPRAGDKPEIRFNPFVLYKIKHTFTLGGWSVKHKLIDRYGDLYSAVLRIRQEQGYGV